LQCKLERHFAAERQAGILESCSFWPGDIQYHDTHGNEEI